ncbi:MAG: tRNA uridine-5-carboxymethylaminomethyl(34) synthesis GTPase MnmE [Bacteroidetes bacterium]|nr:tRNA uridine-5-carboxymethylaminomethyl(34) synthesis GTPase MnmE [Bacteroidota bacterium]
MTKLNTNDTICALATPPGSSAIAVLRVSGKDSFKVSGKIFTAKKKGFNIREAETHTLHYGSIGTKDQIIDDILLSIFRKPHSYTGEDAVEISCHGSAFIVQQILTLLLDAGCRMAQPGEFTLRAFLNGKLDLSQAEGVGDLIAANSKASHKLALDQMRGGFSKMISGLREQLMQFASLIELELDFSEEDVEFADRNALKKLLEEIRSEVQQLHDSFAEGNVMKSGVPVAIIGKPNVGKSTLLNAILNEERAIVSDIPGTTRDAIEDTIVINGLAFRFIDTAGLRETGDRIETLGIERTYEKIRQARIILYLFDITSTDCMEVKESLEEFKRQLGEEGMKDKHFILIANKIDRLVKIPRHFRNMVEFECIFVSAKRKENISMITESLVKAISMDQAEEGVIVSNARHHEALSAVLEALNDIDEGFKKDIPSDLIAIDIRKALYHLGEITGEISNDDLLGNIFSRFCIGK